MRTDNWHTGGFDSEMTDVEPGDPEFSSSGRSGRRNAIPDIRGSSDTPGPSEVSNEPDSKKREIEKEKGERKTNRIQNPNFLISRYRGRCD
uniref:Uncharacterized protein n=1 Tax=Monodelphis domestica TaxID=13616 RepID=A0A5F8GKC4_MONDO